eukprot:5514223-Amphidinium_carterae.1
MGRNRVAEWGDVASLGSREGKSGALQVPQQHWEHESCVCCATRHLGRYLVAKKACSHLLMQLMRPTDLSNSAFIMLRGRPRMQGPLRQNAFAARARP